MRVDYAQPVGEGHVRCTLVGAERGRIDAIAFRAGQSALGPALLDPARPVLHVAGALRIDRYGGRESVRLQIDDAASAAGSVLAGSGLALISPPAAPKSSRSSSLVPFV